MKKVLHVDATEEKDNTFDITISGKCFDKESIQKLFDLLEDFSEDNDIFTTFPVLRALEDPKLMAELDKRMKSIEDGTTKLIPWEDVKKKYENKT